MKAKMASLIRGLLFGLLALLVLWGSLSFSYVCHMMYGLDLSSSLFGTAVTLAGIATIAVGVVGVILGIISLCKGKKALAFLFVFLGAIYGGLIFGGIVIDDALSVTRLEADIENRMEETYGEGWDSPSAIEGIPELYQRILNQFYVAVTEQWPAENLMDLGAVSMPNHYGDTPLEAIGFTLMDLNGDHVDELVIGSTAEGGTAVFCVYTDPENPFYSISSVEGQEYYLHPGQEEGTYEAEIVGLDAALVIAPAQEANTFDFHYREGAMDSANRITLTLTPFSQYK